MVAHIQYSGTSSTGGREPFVWVGMVDVPVRCLSRCPSFVRYISPGVYLRLGPTPPATIFILFYFLASDFRRFLIRDPIAVEAGRGGGELMGGLLGGRGRVQYESQDSNPNPWWGRSTAAIRRTPLPVDPPPVIQKRQMDINRTFLDPKTVCVS